MTKILKLGKRVVCLTMVMLMMVACLPLNALAAQPNIVIINSSVNSSGNGSSVIIEKDEPHDHAAHADDDVDYVAADDPSTVASENVAKVGNTEYATIDEAIANWTNGTTLTLLADVTLSDVIKLSSTEYHILDLGTYTMTAATTSKKYPVVGTVTTYYDAIEIVNNGRSSASWALDIKADATNPGGITASGKAVVKTTGKSGVKDRPIIRFYNGVFTGTNVVYHSGSNGTNCPQFQFHGGVFNGTINTNRALNQFYGGTFNGSLNMSVDSSAYTLIAGGRFKYLSNLFGSSLSSDKFTIGSAKGVYDRGIYVDKDGYYVVTSGPITEVSAKYPAVKKESYNSNNYFYYSAASTYGMFYEVASMAGTGSNVTKIDNADVIDEIKNNTALKDYTPDNLPAGAELEIVLKSVGETFVFDVTPMANGEEVEPTGAITFRLPVPASVTKAYAKVYHEGELMGIYAIQGEDDAKYVEVSSADFSEYAVEPTVVAAKIGDVYYETIQAAIDAAQNDDTVVIFAGEYGSINISNKNITIQGTVGDNGELLTTIKGGNPAITGHGFNGTIKDIKIVDAFKVMYAEPAGNVTVDNVYVTGATYGLHLVAYSTDLTWTIQNSYMDLSWANSFGVYGNGDAAIVITGNEFVSTSPYYPDYGALAVNTFLPNVTVTENIFGENAKILIRDSVTDTSKVNISKNYHADGYTNAFVGDSVEVTIDSYYTDKEMTNLKETPKGNNFIGYTGTDGIWGEVWGNATESFVIKVLDANGNVMGTTSLNNVGGIINGNVNVTWHLKFDTASNTDEYWTMNWTTAPSADNMPAKVELWVDGVRVSGGDVVLNGPDGLNKIVAAVANSNGKISGYCTTLQAAIDAVQEGDIITLLADVTLSEKLTLPAGITLNGNGKSITGAEVWAGGDLTFKGYTKLQMFNAGYNNPTITIGEGATLELTSTGRMVIGHGATFNITGNITAAKTANVADLTPSLIAAGASFTGAGVNFNVTNAYIKFTAYCSSKNSSAKGTFNINVTNSIWEQTGSLVFTEPTNGMDPTFNFTVKDSVLNSTSHLVFAVTKGEIVFVNSNVNVGNYRQLENRSTLTIKNGSVVYASVQISSNAKNPGTTIVDNATYVTTGEFSGADVGTGTLIIKKGANVTMGKITKANIVIDATDMTAGELANFTADLSGFAGTLTVRNNPELCAKIVDGKIVLIDAVAKIGETGYVTLAAALEAAKDGDVITLIWSEGDAPIAMNGAVYGKTVTITGTATVDWSKGFLFVGRGGEGNGTVIFDNATLTSASNSASYGIHVSGREKNTNNKYDGTLIINNSSIELDYLINKGTMTLDNSTLTVKNGFAVGGRPASETETGEDAIATITLNNSSTLVVNNHNGMGLGYEAIGVMNVNSGSTFETTQNFLVTAKGTMNIAGTVKIAGTLTNNGAIVLTGENATITANECGKVTTNLVDYNLVYADGAYKLVAKVYVAQIGDVKYESVQAAIDAAQNGDTVVIFAGEYGSINISNKNITIQGTVGDNGELLTTIKGGNPAITGHGFNGTIKDIKIVDAFKVMYAEPAGNVTVDNVYVTGATYGLHLVAYSTDLTWTIQNSYMDLSWANSFGVYGNGDAAIVIKGNEFVSTNPYYSDYGAIHVNSFLPNVTVEENIFGENAKIKITTTDTSKLNISNNYHSDGVENAFADDSKKVTIYQYYENVDESGALINPVDMRAAQIGDVKYNTLQDAINAVQNGETITLRVDITENVTLTEKTGLYYTIDGNGKQMNGTITISSLSDTNDNRRITIKGINFVDTADANVDFISSVNTNHYPRLTIEGCSFTGSGNDGDVAVRLKSSHSVVIKGCTGTGLHSFLQNTSGWNLTIENVTVTDSKSGLALGTVQGVTVKGCDITADGYGIRLDTGYNNNAVIESNTVKAFIPVVVRKATVDSTITFNGTNTMTATNTDGIWMAVGTSEYEANGSLPTAATGNINVTVNETVNTTGSVYGVLMGSGTEEDPYMINNVNDLIFFRDSVNAGETKYNAEGVYVVLTADIDLADIDWSVNIGDDCNATFDGIFDGKNHTIKNLTSTETAAKADGYICTGLFGAIYGSAVIKNLIIENVNINTGDFTGNNVAAVVGFAYSCTGSIENVKVIGNIQINAKNATGTGVIVGYAYGGELTIEYCAVGGTALVRTGSAVTGRSYVGGIIGYAGGKVTLSGNTIQNLAVTAEGGAAGGVAGIMLGGGVAANNVVKNVTLASKLAECSWCNCRCLHRYDYCF